MGIPEFVRIGLEDIQARSEQLIDIADGLIADTATPMALKSGYLSDVRRHALWAYNDAATLLKTNNPLALD